MSAVEPSSIASEAVRAVIQSAGIESIRLMNPATDTEVPHPADSAAGPSSFGTMPPSNWREALLTLISSRVALIQLESQDWKRESAKRAAFLSGMLLCGLFGWALLLAGGIALLSSTMGWPWHGIALVAAALHLLAAVFFMRLAKGPTAPSFPVTRAEFQKDREWIQNFQKTRKS